MKLYSQPKCAITRNLRRIFAAAIILVVAFDYTLNVYAATVDYVGKNVYLASGSTLTHNSANSEFVGYYKLNNPDNYIVSFPSPTDFVNSSSASELVRYEVVFPVFLASDITQRGTYFVDVDVKLNLFYEYIGYISSSYEGPFLLFYDQTYVETPSPDFVTRFYPVGLKLNDTNSTVHGGTLTLSEGKSNSKKFTFRMFGDIPFYGTSTSTTGMQSPTCYIHIFFSANYGGSGLTDFGTRRIRFGLSVDDYHVYTFEDGDYNGDASTPGTITDYRDEDRDDATQAGEDSKSFVEDAMDLENKWSILWFPIKFTNKILDVFTGGTSAVAYQDSFRYVVGYSYDDDSGMLYPVIDKSRSVARSGGTIISFPAFTLPVLDVQLWDSYDFDLSTIKESFPVLFDSLYVVSSVIEVYAFVGFLRDKYEEVFG